VALNQELVGREYPPFTYEVAREKIREYATALGESDPRYFSDGDDCVAPPTFAACFSLTQGGAPLFADPELGAHWNLVHGSQRYEFGRHLRPGDVLTVTPRLADITLRGDNEFMTVEVEARHADGELALLSTAVIVLFPETSSEEA
jgi:hypothetical protein